MKDDRLYLIHILECIERIERYTADSGDAFMDDTKTQDAVMRNLAQTSTLRLRITSRSIYEQPGHLPASTVFICR